MGNEKTITEQDLINRGHKDKVSYLKSQGLEWMDCKFGNTLGGYVKDSIHISARSIERESLSEIKRRV